MRTLWLWVMLILGAQTLLPMRCHAFQCDRSPRNISPFGAEGSAPLPLRLNANLRSQLRGLHDVRRVLDTRLSPLGKKIVIYDASADDYDPHPTVAIFVGDRLVKKFDERKLNAHAGGFERYLSSCEFDLTPDQRALAVVVSAGGDGAGSAFAIIAWQSGEYRVVFNPAVGQGRMEFTADGLKLWQTIWGKADKTGEDVGEFECVWCPHRYAIANYVWRNGWYVKTGSIRTRKKYDPAKISGAPLLAR